MMKKQFEINDRAKIESGEYEVVTFDDHPVRIICWDAMPEWPICAMIKDYSEKSTYAYPQLFDENGKCIKESSKDLYVTTPEPELTEFEKACRQMMLNWYNHVECTMDDDFVREEAANLLNVAAKYVHHEATEEDVLDFRDSHPLEWASILGPERNAAYAEGKEEALKVINNDSFNMGYEKGKKETLEQFRHGRMDWGTNNCAYLSVCQQVDKAYKAGKLDGSKEPCINEDAMKILDRNAKPIYIHQTDEELYMVPKDVAIQACKVAEYNATKNLPKWKKLNVNGEPSNWPVIAYHGNKKDEYLHVNGYEISVDGLFDKLEKEK